MPAEWGFREPLRSLYITNALCVPKTLSGFNR